MNRSWLAIGLLLVLSACGGKSHAARFSEDVFPEAAGDLDGASTVDVDEVDLLDLLDRKDLDLDGDGANTLDLDELDFLDELDRKDQQNLDAGADAVPACGGGCGPYQICDGASGKCVANPLCETEFCAAAPDGAEKITVGLEASWVDRYEWPNQKGAVPLGAVETQAAAAALCRSVGKRLCGAAELAAACSGGSKYPYGDTYDGTACNTELPYVVKESGAFEKCHTQGSGIYDVVGNLAEWTSEGRVFGGSLKEGLKASCQKFDEVAAGADTALLGLRCCVSAGDDIDGDGYQASLDCDDLNKDINSGAVEACDNIDNDCNGRVDDTADEDQDGYNTCRDCDDAAFSIHPKATDTFGDGVDANCDGIDGEDFDGDGVASKESGGTDCNDASPAVKPGAPDLCDGFDNDCNGEVDSPLPEGACDDGEVCTVDSCAAGACRHDPLACDDGNPCTDDVCVQGKGCQYSENNLPCTDKNPCTENDQCVLGECRGQPKSCDDGKVCTTDGCDSATGSCTYAANTAPCDNGDPCSTGDYCQDKECKGGAGVLPCDDGSDCTFDECKPGTGCVNTARLGACDDGDPCTTPDTCALGVCTPGPNKCFCTKDADCTTPADWNWCNGVLYCNLNKNRCEVKPGTAVKCLPDKDTVCSVAACDPKVGVCFPTARNEGAPCEKTCTLTPVCQNGACQGTSCSAAGMACIGGACLSKTCTPSQRVCDGAFAFVTCNSAGNGWSASTSCGTGQFCDAGQCKPQVCTPKQVTCVGRLAGTCNDAGSGLLPGYTDCQTIPATPFCLNGACSTCAPSCTGRVCGSDGCGGSCGTCGAGKVCLASGQCCTQSCNLKNCGLDGCGGTCGDCGAGGACNTQGRCTFSGNGLTWVSIPAGTFWMGCAAADNYCYTDEEPQHKVTVSAFEMLETEVTEGQYKAVTGKSPSSYGMGADYPVESVTWYNAKDFCQAVGGRLPTEAEWEYAGRAGTSTIYYCGDNSSCLWDTAWYYSNSYGYYSGGYRKHAVKTKTGNAFGLYDVMGNVREWVNDWWDYYSSGAVTDPQGPQSGTYRVRRGGSFYGYYYDLTMSLRGEGSPSDYGWTLGFRCAR